MNNLSIKEYIYKSKRDYPCIDIIKQNTQGAYNLIFDEEDKIISGYFYKIKNLIKNKPYSLTLNSSTQLDFLIDLFGDNKRIQILTINSQILNKLIITNLYKDIFPQVQELVITGTVQNVINDIQLEKFALKSIVLQNFDPQFSKQFTTITQIIEFCDRFTILNMNFKKLQQIDISQLSKFNSDILIRVNTKSVFDMKQVSLCVQILNRLKNIKKVILEYPLEDKTQNLHSSLMLLEKEIELIIHMEHSAQPKWLANILKNSKFIKHITLNIPLKLVNDNYKGINFFNSTSLTSISLKVGCKQLLDLMLVQLCQLKHQITHLTCVIDDPTTLKLLNTFLDQNTVLKYIDIAFNYQSIKLNSFYLNTLPLLSKIISLKEVTLQFKKNSAQIPLLQDIYSYLPNLNIASLKLKQVNQLDFCQDNIINGFKSNKSLSNLAIQFIQSPSQQINHSKCLLIYEEIHMNENQTIKIHIENLKDPTLNYHIYNQMNQQIDRSIYHSQAFNNVVAPLMTFSPQQIYLDLYVN